MKNTTEIINFGDVQVGDKIISSDGTPSEVTAVYDTHIPEKMFEFYFENGQKIECSGNHLWYSETAVDRDSERKLVKLANHFFKKEELLEIADEHESSLVFQKQALAEYLARTKRGQEFIARTCDTIGPTVSTPVVFFDGYMDLVGETELWYYSLKDTIEYLNKLKMSFEKGIIPNVFIGKVRTANDLFTNHTEINIPSKGELNG